MKAYERREAGAYPFFKLAVYDPRSLTWRAGKATAATEEDVRSMARRPGRYRIERFDADGSYVAEPFDV